MSKYENKNETAKCALNIYKAAKMGADSISCTMSKIKDPLEKERIREALTRQFSEYENIALQAQSMLLSMNVEPKEENPMVKMMSKTGIAMNMLKDSTSSHVSEMLIQGLTMGITEGVRLSKKAKKHGCDGKLIKLADDFVDFQEDSIDEMKRFL